MILMSLERLPFCVKNSYVTSVSRSPNPGQKDFILFICASELQKDWLYAFLFSKSWNVSSRWNEWVLIYD